MGKTDIFGPVEENSDENIEEEVEEVEEEEEKEEEPEEEKKEDGSRSEEKQGEADNDDEPDPWRPLREKEGEDLKEPYLHDRSPTVPGPNSLSLQHMAANQMDLCH